MVDVEQTLREGGKIRVAVVAVGDISHSKFKEYSNMVKCFSLIQLRHIPSASKTSVTPNQTISTPSTSSPFPQQSWLEGKLEFNFVDTDSSLSDWEELQAHRKVFGVVGIVHCQKYGGDLSLSIREFREVLQQRYPSVLHAVCFAFEPLHDQPDIDISAFTSSSDNNNNMNFIMIPNGDKKKLLFYLNTWLVDFAERMLNGFERRVIASEQQQQQAYIATPLDSWKSSEEITRLKKKKQGRLLKQHADLALLSASPHDALSLYTEAIEATKSNSDWEWTAAGLEGYCSSLLLLSSAGYSSSISIDNTRDVLETKMAEAIGYYNKRKATILELEATFKLARLYIEWWEQDKQKNNTNNNNNRDQEKEKKRKIDACELLMGAYAIGANLSTQIKIVISSTIALLFQRLKMMRKHAFFLRETAILYHKLFNLQTAHSLLLMSLPYYNIFGLSNDHQVDQQTNQDTWSLLQKIILKDLILISKIENDSESTVKYILHMLRKLYYITSEETQIQLYQDFYSCVFSLPLPLQTGLSSTVEMVGIPQLVRIIPHREPKWMEVNTRKREGPTSSLFIFAPWEKKKKQTQNESITWILGDVVHLTIVVSNPMSFPISVRRISLSTSMGEENEEHVNIKFESHNDADGELVLQPKEYNRSITIAGKCVVSSGNPTQIKKSVMMINGCTIGIYDFPFMSVHPVLPNGVATLPFNRGIVGGKPLKASEGRAMEIVIVPQLPILRISAPGESVTKESALRDGIVLEIEKQMVDGECGVCELLIENVGEKTVDFISIEFTPKKNRNHSPTIPVNDAELEETITFDKQRIASLLPLLPLSKLTIPINIFASLFSIVNGATLTIEYGKNEVEEYCRKSIVSINFNVTEGPCLTAFNVSQYYHNLPSPNDERYCVALFEVTNRSSDSIHLTGASLSKGDITVDDITTTLPPRSRCRIKLKVERFVLSEGDISNTELPPSMLSPRSRKKLPKPTPQQEREERMAHAYKLQLMKKITLQWKSLEQQRKGRIVLHSISMREGASMLSTWPIYISSIEFQDKRVPFAADSSELTLLRCASQEFVSIILTIGCCNHLSETSIQLRKSIKIETATNNPTEVLYVGTLQSTHQVGEGETESIPLLLWFSEGGIKARVSIFLQIIKGDEETTSVADENTLQTTTAPSTITPPEHRRQPQRQRILEHQLFIVSDT